MIGMQKRSANRPKLYTLHALPAGKGFIGSVTGTGGRTVELTFVPTRATLERGAEKSRLQLSGTITIRPGTRAGRTRTIEGVTATLLATQGSVSKAPAVPSSLPKGLQPAKEPSATSDGLPRTEATEEASTIAVMYFRLSPLPTTGLPELPYDLSQVQLNARLWANSPLERDLLWLYSAWFLAQEGPAPNPEKAAGYLTEINQRLA